MKLWVLGWQYGRNFDSHILAFHRWIRLPFGYVIMLNVTYILTGGIVNSRFRLSVVIGGTFLENHPSRQPRSSAVISSFHRWIGMDFGYCSSKCYINSERLRSEINTPTKNCTSRTVGL